MAQPKAKQPKRTPAYSSESLAIRVIGGLLLIGLGVLIFLACDLNMNGTVFQQLRCVCRGLSGAMSTLLAFLPVWGGVLAIASAQRKAPAKPFVLACALFLLLTNCITLVSSVGSTQLMRYYADTAGREMDYGSCMVLAYDFSFKAAGAYGGGLLGAILAWPLWTFLTQIPGVIILVALILGDLWLMVPKKLRRYAGEKLKARKAEYQAADAQRKAEEAQRQIQWQQEQAARAMQAQQLQGQPMPMQGMAQPEYQQPVSEQPAIGFGATPEESQPIRQEKQEKKAGFVSRILGRDKGDVQDTARQSAVLSGTARPARAVRRMDAEMVDRQAPQQPVQYTAAQQAQYTMPQQPVYQQQEQYTAPQQPVYQQQNQYTMSQQPVYQPEPVAEAHQPDQPDPRIRVAAEPARPAQQSAAVKPVQPAVTEKPERSAPPAALEKPKTEWQQKLADMVNRRDKAPEQPEKTDKKVLQKPEPSWTSDADRPPWEDPVTPPPEAPVIPASKSNWQPELDIKQDEGPKLGEEIVEEHQEIPYVYPELDLLALPKPQSGISPEEDQARSVIIEETLASFKIPSQVQAVTHGPAISRFELSIQDGIKVDRVSSLHQNLAMKLAVKSVRIEAPIPGKSLVGVEVPNREKANVTLREVLVSDQMRNAKSTLTVALGKDIAGTPVVCDLAKMPHLLIAGSTGSGKSVCINTIINSLLYRCSPKEVRLILVDPKVVELNCYNGVPHLLLPVVSNPKKASGALAWAVGEMMDRYERFRVKGVRNIEGYNNALEEGEEFMPRIVIIIDELADLMMTCKREVEDHIVRLAQLARAAGMHMIVATQRPSVDVITGLIKANIPSRIAFKVSSFIDSRTILDRMGAEQLLGWGDMLYSPTGSDAPIRVQGCFLSDQEVNSITDFIRKNSPADYDPNIIEQLNALTEDGGPADPSDVMVGGEDEVTPGDGSLIEQCVEMAVTDGQISTSLVQRRLRVGYARAGRLVDELEKRGILSAKDGTKPRMCLITREEYEQMKEAGTLKE